MTSKEKEILSEYYDKTIKKSLDEYLNFRIIEQEIKKELLKNKDLKNIFITRISIDDRDMDNPYCIVDFADVKNNNSITYSFPMKTKVLLFLNEKGKLVDKLVDAKLTMKQVVDRLSKDEDFRKVSEEMVSNLKTKGNKKEYIDFGIAPYALPKILLALHNAGVYEYFITQEDNDLHIRINEDYLFRTVYPAKNKLEEYELGVSAENDK